MPSTHVFNCHACGAALDVSGDGGQKCAYCGSHNEFVFSKGEIKRVQREVNEVVAWAEERKAELDVEFQQVMMKVAMGDRSQVDRAVDIMEASTRLSYAPTLAMLSQPGMDDADQRETIEKTVKQVVEQLRASFSAL